MSRKRAKPRRGGSSGTPPTMEVNLEELVAIVERAKPALSAEEHTKLVTAMATLASTTQIVAELIAQLQGKKTSLERLRRMLFGSPTEKTEQVLGEERAGAGRQGAAQRASADGAPARKKAPGHGRNAASAYSGAEHIQVAHADLSRGDACPGCPHGKVYPLEPPAVLVRITGMAPLGARVYACDRLRCNLCGEVYTAAAPAGVGSEKYDASATAMVGMLRYGTGLPFNRIEQLQKAMRVPLPAATQWDLVNKCGATIKVRARDNQGERRCRGATIMPSCVVVCKSDRRGILSATGRGATWRCEEAREGTPWNARHLRVPGEMSGYSVASSCQPLRCTRSAAAVQVGPSRSTASAIVPQARWIRSWRSRTTATAMRSPLESTPKRVSSARNMRTFSRICRAAASSSVIAAPPVPGQVHQARSLAVDSRAAG